MLVVVEDQNASQYRDLLDEMFRLRARVFNDRLKWDVVVKGGMERDRYDDEGPVYLIYTDEEQKKVKGSLRLLPTTGPTLLAAAMLVLAGCETTSVPPPAAPIALGTETTPWGTLPRYTQGHLRPSSSFRPGGAPPPGKVVADVLVERDGRVLADIERGQRMTALDRAGLRGVPDLQRRHDLAAGEDLDLELPVGQLADTLGHGFDGAVNRVQALRPTRRQPPTNRRTGLSDRRARERGRGCADNCSLEKRAPLHFGSPC